MSVNYLTRGTPMRMISSPSDLRRNLLSASAFMALVLIAGMAQATTQTVSSVSVAGITPSETDNDFLRIKNALAGLNAGETLVLDGTFNWAEEFARASYLDFDGTNFVNQSAQFDTTSRYVGLKPPAAANITISGMGTARVIAPVGAERPAELVQTGRTGITSFMGFQGVSTTNLTIDRKSTRLNSSHV